jgi:hypothetical protein
MLNEGEASVSDILAKVFVLPRQARAMADSSQDRQLCELSFEDKTSRPCGRQGIPRCFEKGKQTAP